MSVKVIVLLASKCSGSSALQNYLVDHFNVKTLSKVPHHENETLFWTKAASALKYPQKKMHRSKVPYSADEGLKMLNQLLLDNGAQAPGTDINENAVFRAFGELACKHGAVFFEKSPHHLFNYSNIELILKCKEFIKEDIDLHIIGLIRNPADTIYSAWARWKFNCREFENEWLQSYRNLHSLMTASGVTLFKYEEIVQQPFQIDIFCNSIGIQKKEGSFQFNNKSLNKRKTDHGFKHELGKDTIDLARAYGYSLDDVSSLGKPDLNWKLIESARNLFYQLKEKVRRF